MDNMTTIWVVHRLIMRLRSSKIDNRYLEVIHTITLVAQITIKMAISNRNQRVWVVQWEV